MESRMPSKIEKIELTDTGVAVGFKDKDGYFRHVTDDYKIVSDGADNEGNRVIVLAPLDLTEHRRNVKEIVEIISKQVKDSGKPFKELLGDVLNEYWPEKIAEILGKLKAGMSAKTKEGCFKLIIGDQRRRDSEEITLRE